MTTATINWSFATTFLFLFQDLKLSLLANWLLLVQNDFCFKSLPRVQMHGRKGLLIYLLTLYKRQTIREMMLFIFFSTGFSGIHCPSCPPLLLLLRSYFYTKEHTIFMNEVSICLDHFSTWRNKLFSESWKAVQSLIPVPLKYINIILRFYY